MRVVAAACLFAAACATSPAPPAERLAGCWIGRDGAVTMTMRWLADAERPGVLAGARLIYGADGSVSNTDYALAPGTAGSRLCELGADGAAARCWEVAEGEGGSLESGRAFIDRHGERLRIAIIGDGPEQLVFAGRRDGCD